jgi:hypothetical protein
MWLKPSRACFAALSSKPCPTEKQNKKNIEIEILGAGGVTQVAEHLSSNCEALHSNPSTTKKY